MVVLNLAVTALFESLSRNNLDKSLLIEGTGLNLNYLLDVKKKHRWDQFVKMYDNCARLLGPEKAAREIAYHGINNEKMSIQRKIGTGFIDVKTGYWFLVQYGSKHLFKNTVHFTYSKISSKEIIIEINIAPDKEACPLLFETYAYLYENASTLFGLPKAEVMFEADNYKAKYYIKFSRTLYAGHLFSLFLNYIKGHKTTVQLLGEVENQSREYSKQLEEKSQLLRMLSHDIANQVSIIDHSLKKTLRKEHLAPEDLEPIDLAYKSTMRLKNILNDARKIELVHMNGIQLARVDLDPVFQSISEQFKHKLDEKNILLKCENNLPVGVMPLAEQSSLEINVLCNLISNAIKFSHSNSLIKLEAHYLRGFVYLSVTDCGVGISDEMRAHLFNQKIRHSSIGTNNEQGTGFGLGIVQNYIHLYGGKISVHRNYPTGTIFEIELEASLPELEDSIYENNSKTTEANFLQ